jgi:hypothetical protein
MPSFTEFGLFIAAFVGGFAFADDVLRYLGLPRLISEWWRRR